MSVDEDISCTLRAETHEHHLLFLDDKSASKYCLNDQGGTYWNITEDITATIQARTGGHRPLVFEAPKQNEVKQGHNPLVFENHGKDARYTGPLETSPTVTAAYGTGGNNQPFVVDNQPFVVNKEK